MQEAEQTAPTELEEKHPIHAKIISMIVTAIFLSPLIAALINFKWERLSIIPLLIIAISIAASVWGVWRISEQLVTVIREGGDSDFRER